MTEASDAWTGKPISNQQRKSLRFVTLPELCEILDVSPKSVRDMILSPSFPFHEKGRPGTPHLFDTAAVINWLKERERKRADKGGNDETKSRLDEIKIQRAEFELAERRGDLIHFEDYGPFIEDRLVEMRQRLIISVVSNVRRQFNEEVAQFVYRENAAALNDLSKGLAAVPELAKAQEQQKRNRRPMQ